MKPIKIVIKSEGLFVRTKDLNVGLKILNHIADHGIMKYTIVSDLLLAKISEVLSKTANRGEIILSLINKLKKSHEDSSLGFKTPEATEKASEIPVIERLEIVPLHASQIKVDMEKSEMSKQEIAEAAIDKNVLAEAFNKVAGENIVNPDDIKVKIINKSFAKKKKKKSKGSTKVNKNRRT